MRVRRCADGRLLRALMSGSLRWSGPLALGLCSSARCGAPLSPGQSTPASGTDCHTPAPCPSEQPYPPWDGLLGKCFDPSSLSQLKNIGVTLTLGLHVQSNQVRF